EAERFAEEDKKKKETIEIRNNGDNLVYQTEKTLKEVEGKISADEKSKAETKLEELKKSLEGDNYDEIKQKTAELTEVFYSISQKMYDQAGAGANPGEGSGPSDDVVDADYELVD